MSKLKNKIKKTETEKIIGIVIIIILAIIGVKLLISSHAESPYTSIEAESGTLSGGATIISDSNASGGKGVQFTNTNSGLIYGISDPNLISETSSLQQSQLAQMKSIGINSVRVEMNQEWVQYNGAGTFDWSQMDPMMANIKAAGMTADIVIDGAASWDAVDGNTSGYVQPLTPSDFAAWCSAVVTRYKSDANIFEIWNEPNLLANWYPGVNPQAYTQDLQAAYSAIKAIDPSSIVISAGLAPTNDDGSSTLSPTTFLSDMYANGAAGYMDGVGAHPYSYPALPDTYESWSGWSEMDQTTPSLMSIMAANGDGNKDIYITEVGAPSNGPDGIGNTDQATEMTQAIQNAQTTPWIKSIYIYTWQDDGTDTTNDEDWFGLLNYAGAEKPDYTAVQQAIQE